MKVIVNILLVFLGSTVLIGCESEETGERGQVAGVSGSGETKQVLDNWEDLLNESDSSTIRIPREDLQKIIEVFRPGTASESADKPEESPAESPVMAKTESPDPVHTPPADSPVSETPVNKEMKALPKVAAESVDNSSGEKGPKESDAEPVKRETETAKVSPKKPAHAIAAVPDSSTARPDQFPEVIEDLTTGFEFKWDDRKGVWISSSFQEYLQGSTRQNESFCWLLTQNSQGVDKSSIPEGWVHLPLNDRKSVVIVEKTRVKEIAAALGTLNALPAVKVAEKPEQKKVVPPSKESDTNKPAVAKTEKRGNLKDAPAEEKDAPVPAPSKEMKTDADTKVTTVAETESTPEKNVQKEKPVEKVAVKAPSDPEISPPVQEEPARTYPVSEVLPVGAMLPDGRRLVAPPQHASTVYHGNSQTQGGRPNVRAIPAKRVEPEAAESRAQPDKNTENPQAVPAQPVPSARSRPVIRPTITIKSRRVGNVWKNDQEQPAKPKQ